MTTTLASSLIQRVEAADGWDELPPHEQLALRAILRGVALIAIRGKSTAEDWQQLVGFVEWRAPAAAPSAAAPLTLADEWTPWSGGGHPRTLTGGTHVDVRLRNGRVVRELPAGSVYWPHVGSALDVVAYRLAE